MMLECFLGVGFLEKLSITIGYDQSVEFLILWCILLNFMIIMNSIVKILILVGNITLFPYLVSIFLNALKKG